MIPPGSTTNASDLFEAPSAQADDKIHFRDTPDDNGHVFFAKRSAN